MVNEGRATIPGIVVTPSDWLAFPTTEPRQALHTLTPLRVDARWRSLRQSWLSSGREPGFEPGWARVTWQTDALCYEMVFVSGAARNRSRKLNERAWELGDVAEVYLQAREHDYIELQVTPENHRLQLRWRGDGRERVKGGELPLEDFMVNDPTWVTSATYVGMSFWVAQVKIPACAICGQDGRIDRLGPLRTAVCRYDYGLRNTPVISSTADLSCADFHRPQEWSPLSLAPDKTSAIESSPPRSLNVVRANGRG